MKAARLVSPALPGRGGSGRRPTIPLGSLRSVCPASLPSCLRGGFFLLLLLGLVLTYIATDLSGTPPSGLAPAGEVGPSSTPLNITSFTVSSPTVLIESPVWFNLTAVGGAPPYTYWYHSLPPGCHSTNVSSIMCYPSSAQRYTIVGTVNDTAADHAKATVNLTVKNGFGQPPEILSFQINPDTVAVGKITYLVVNAVSESGTPTDELAYSFLGLPPGCGSFNQTNLSCVPSEPGMYKVWARVTDSYSQINQTALYMNVTGNATTPTTPASTGLSNSTKEYIVAGIGIGIVLVVAVAYLQFVRRPPSPGTSAASSSAPPDAPSSPPGPGSDG
jgi:hypothetical protein